MDGMERMGPRPISYFINRGMGAPASGSQLGIHVTLGMPRSLPIPNPSFAAQNSVVVSSGSFQEASLPSISPQGVNVEGTGVGEPVRRRRGRPRKYGPERSMSLALPSMPSPPPPSDSGTASSGPSLSVSATPSRKRGRGRPPGSGWKQRLASLGEWPASSAGIAFTPHVVTIPVGEDITSRIMSFSLQGPRAVCILSANGAVSTVTLRQPATSVGDVTYEEHFDILCMSGSYWPSDEGGSQSRSGGLSISLSSPDGRVIGGVVGGLLIAASPVQVIVGSFKYKGSKSKRKTKKNQDGEESEKGQGDEQRAWESSGRRLPNKTSSRMGGSQGERQTDTQSTSNGDIDLMLG